MTVVYNRHMTLKQPALPVTFRIATVQDADELARLRWDFSPDEVQSSVQSFEDFGREFGVFLQSALGSQTWAIWVAECQGRLIGNIYVKLVDKVPRPGRFSAKYGYVTNVYVEPQSQRLGVGSKLLQSVIAWAREQRLEFLIVWPWPRDDTIRFYERCGFARSVEAFELAL